MNLIDVEGQVNMTELKYKDGKPVIEKLEDIEQFIQKKFPEGLDEHLDKTFFNNGAYIGFNLCRYGYTSELAAECHAMRDLLMGKIGSSYGFEFEPHVKHHPKTETDDEYWEVYTG